MPRQRSQHHRRLEISKRDLNSTARSVAIATALIGLAVLSMASAADDQSAPPNTTADSVTNAPQDPALQRDVPVQPEVIPPASTSTAAPPPTAPSSSAAAPTAKESQNSADRNSQRWLQIDPDAYSIVSAGRGLSLHKPMYLLPLTWSEDYHGRATEVLFEVSLKQRMFGIPLYFAYTQKSFWQAYNSKRSSPFRETDFNPEIFYRWIPEDQIAWHHLGADIGFEHESNGQSLPDSRSWNRLYLAPFQAAGKHVIYWKWWWRLPEDESKPRTDPQRDDNPDIHDYYGYSELSFEQQLWDKHLAHAMLRWNPATGKAAFNLQYSIPGGSDSFFWMFYLWQGYGESLIDYNRSITRVGVGVMFSR